VRRRRVWSPPTAATVKARCDLIEADRIGLDLPQHRLPMPSKALDQAPAPAWLPKRRADRYGLTARLIRGVLAAVAGAGVPQGGGPSPPHDKRQERYEGLGWRCLSAIARRARPRTRGGDRGRRLWPSERR